MEMKRIEINKEMNGMEMERKKIIKWMGRGFKWERNGEKEIQWVREGIEWAMKGKEWERNEKREEWKIKDRGVSGTAENRRMENLSSTNDLDSSKRKKSCVGFYLQHPFH